jgi:indolepyruvate decarboxylase
MINSSDKPLILAGVEVNRFKLWDQVTALASTARIPIADTILGKSIVSGGDPLYIGFYAGEIENEESRCYVESSVLHHHAGRVSHRPGYGSRHRRRSILAGLCTSPARRVAISRRYYLGVGLDLLSGLAEADLLKHDLGDIPHLTTPEPFCDVSCDKKITAKRLFEVVNTFVD